MTLPAELHKEAFDAYYAIYSKYRKMQKDHMNKDRIIGIMYVAELEARQEFEKRGRQR